MTTDSPLTLHIRLTKACNATCTYCSSWQESPDERIRPDSLARMVEFILDTAPEALGITPTHVTAQFLGGEIATVPFRELEECIDALKVACGTRKIKLVFGAQSNLIVSTEKAAKLYDLFEGRIGTSIDLTSDARQVAGSSDRYNLIWKQADTYLRKNRSTPGAVYVLDPSGINDAQIHLLDSARYGRMLTLRPVFQGGMAGQEICSPDALDKAMGELFNSWFMRLPVMVEPFFQLTQSRVMEVTGLGSVVSTACAFQSDCTKKSLNIDPNGDIHVCLEMADAGLAPIGNALAGEWYSDAIRMYSSREENLHDDCKRCPYLKSCQGGCMFEAISQGQGVHGKSNLCGTWKTLFRMIDEGVEFYGAEQVHGWLHRLATKQANSRSNGIASGVLARLDREAVYAP